MTSPKIMNGASHLGLEPILEQRETGLLFDAQDRPEPSFDGVFTLPEVDFGALQPFKSRLDLLIP